MTIDRESNLAQAYLYHRQQRPRNGAMYAIVNARRDIAVGKRRYAHGTDFHYGGRWETEMKGWPGRYKAGIAASDQAYYCDDWPDGWRLHGRADEVCRREDRSRAVDHKGWYTDDDGDTGTLAGYVLQLPSRNGVPQYVPGTAQTDCFGKTLYPLDRYDDPVDCARAADRYAEIAAERECDYQRGWDAGSQAAELKRENVRLRRQALQVCADLKAVKRTFVVPADEALTRLCATIRADAIGLRNQIQSNYEKINDLTTNHGGDDDGFSNGLAEG